MEKNKRDIVVLLVLLTFLINYIFYSNVISPKLNSLKESKNKYNQLQEKINTAINLKIKEKSIKQEVEKLTKETEKLSVLTPNSIDTPQLIYDFYNYCKKHGVVGDTIEFQLEDDKQGEQTQEELDSKTQETNQDNQNQQQSTEKENLKVLDITLDVYCSKEKLDEFLNNLNDITTRRLNIKSITISQPTQINTVVNEENVIDEHTQKIQGKLPVKIVFLQYIYLDGKNYKNNYDFFNIKLGFDKIGDIFKN